MPKLFFRKKKKEKHGIRDAITPSPAFIAVPSTPPPVKNSPTKSLRESSASPNKKLEISTPTLLPPGSNPFSNDPTVLASKQSAQQQPAVPEAEIGAANYSLVGAAEGDDLDHVECEAEPGYATVARHTGAASGSHSGVVITGGGAGGGGGQLERSRDCSVGADGYNHLSVEDRPRLATPRHEQAISGQRDVDIGPHHDPRVGAELPSSKSHVHEQERQEDFRVTEKRSLSPVARQAGELGAAVHSYDSIDNAAMLPRRNEIQPRADERGEHDGGQLRPPEQQQTESLYSKVIKPKQQEAKGHNGSRSSRSPRDVVATSVSGHLPPIAPHSSPPPNYRRGREKEKSKSPGHREASSHRKKVSSPRDSSTPHQHQQQYRSRSHSGNSRHDADDSQHHHVNTLGISHHHHSRADGGGAHVKNKNSSKGRSRSYSMPIEAHDPNTSTQSARHQQQHRQRSESYTHTTQPPPPTPEYYYEEGDDIDLPLEYTDQSYLGEESETITCTESYFHDLCGELEGEGEIPGDYVDGGHVTPNRHYRTGGRRQRGSEGGHRRSRSATFPGHVEPHQSISKKRASSPHAAYYSSGHNRSPPQKRQKRPASSGEVPDIPFLQPPSLQPVYPIPQNQVYVFSELQPDGSVQYYSATPVNSPPVISPPPRFNVPSPLPQAPVSNNPAPPTTQLQVPPTIDIAPCSSQPTSTQATPQQQLSFSPSAMNTTPSPHKNVHAVEEEDGATAQGGGASSTLDQPRFTRRVPMGITESGYFSSALASSQQGLSMGKAGGVSPIAIQQERTSTTGGVPHNIIMTDVSPSQLSQDPNLRNNKFHNHGDQHLQMVESPRSGRRNKSPQVSPTAKLLESSLQAANVSSHSISSPIAKSPRGTKSSKSLRLNASLDSSHTGGAATQSLAGMAALHEQKEKVLKVRIKALEDSTVELCTENASLKQLCEALKQDASGSVEHLQRKLSSMLTENQSYREMSRDKDQKLERDQSKIVILEEELAKLKEENRHLLKAQQSADLERKEWERVSEHAQSVLDENVSLLKQQELLREQIKEMKAQHQAIVSGLSSELNKGRKEREAVEKKLISLQESHSSLQSQFGQLVEQSAQQVSISEHQSALKEMHSLLEELEERSDSEVKSQEAQLRILAKEKTSLVTKLTDAKAIILQLEHECTRMHKDLRVAQEKITEQKADLEAARDREVASHDRLSRAVSTAEKAMAERETYARIAKAQQKASERAGIQFALKGATAGNIQRELQMYKQEMDAKLDQANSILREKEREHRVQRRQYQREISHLQVLLKSKQARLDDVTKDKKLAEERLDLLWRASKPTERLATLSASTKPATTTTSGSGPRSTTTNQLQGKLSKLNSQVHPKIT